MRFPPSRIEEAQVFLLLCSHPIPDPVPDQSQTSPRPVPDPDQTRMSAMRVDTKVVMLGKESVGKTSLVERYVHHRFLVGPYQNVSV